MGVQSSIDRRYVGEIPILQAVAKQLGFKQILSKYVKAHGNEDVSAVDTLMMILFNLACGRQPLYELDEWVRGIDPRLFGYQSFPSGTFNDDRFGRALDKLYQADRASLTTDIVMGMVKTIQLDLSRCHNDSTTVKAYGKIAGTTVTGVRLARGHSKDHRPDLKQLVYCLTLSADGAVPIHHKVYPGNRTDDTTHIETWNTIQTLHKDPGFLYVADCKVCTDEQLAHIVHHGGRVITIMPDTWKEARLFKQALRESKKPKKVLWRRKISEETSPGEAQYVTYSCFTGTHVSHKGAYAIHWIYSHEKRKRDRQSRADLLQRVENELRELAGKLNTRRLKTKAQIKERVEGVLKKHGVGQFYHIKIFDVKERSTVQVGVGRPGPSTKHKTKISVIYTLAWSRNRQALKKELNVDGVFPILCTDPSLSAKDALIAYKYQPRLEKRFTQFKSVHHAAPLLFKKIRRVEAIMFLFFLALMLQAVIERQVRASMIENEIQHLPIYPEHRIAYHPTTAKIFDRFHDISIYQLSDNGQPIKTFKDQLKPLHLDILRLLKIPETQYWPIQSAQ
jgi:transposase